MYVCVFVLDKGGGVFITVFRFCLQFVGPALKPDRTGGLSKMVDRASQFCQQVSVLTKTDSPKQSPAPSSCRLFAKPCFVAVNGRSPDAFPLCVCNES